MRRAPSVRVAPSFLSLAPNNFEHSPLRRQRRTRPSEFQNGRLDRTGVLMANPNKMGGNTSPPFGTIPTGAGLTTDADAAARGPTEDATMLSKGLVKNSLLRYAPLPPSLSSWGLQHQGEGPSPNFMPATRCPAAHSMRIVRPSGLACCFKRRSGPWAHPFDMAASNHLNRLTAIALCITPA